MSTEEDEALIELLPRLGGIEFAITSQDDTTYNCVAWALHDTRRFWWPIDQSGYYWPPDAPRELTLESFVTMFEMQGFTVCGDGNHESGTEKVAIFASRTGPEHVARQLPNGQWTSKIGNLHDIRHATLEGLEGRRYGEVTIYMSKVVQS